MAAYHSRFGGLWIDDTDAERVTARVAAIADVTIRRQVNKFLRDGYVILPGAVAEERIDAYLREFEAAAATPGQLLAEVPAEGGRLPFSRARSLMHGTKVLDTAMLLRSGQDLCFADPVTAFLSALFDGPSLAFQTLHFEVGSTQAIHQDTAYVVVDQEPLQLVASWLALEDVTPGSGELIYYIGGHRMPDYSYAGGASKHWNPERDGHPSHNRHLELLRAEAERRGLEQGVFRPKKGDVLLWHADLPHGGGEVKQPGATRRSLVTHYCPLAQNPYYMQFIPEDWRRKIPARGGNGFMSLYFPPDSFARAA